MELVDFYKQRADQYQESSKKNRRYANALSAIRLLIFLLIPVSAVLLFYLSLWLSIAVSLLLLYLFGLSIKLHLQYQREALVDDFISKINNDELRAISGDLKGFYGGLEFKPKDHRYASDLDIFGDSSLYALVCRSSTWLGRYKVAKWLLEQANHADITKRQKAALELSSLIDFRQRLQSFSVKTPDLGSDPTSILECVQEPNRIEKPFKLVVMLILLSAFSVCGIALAIMGKGFVLFTISIICGFVVGHRWSKDISATHERLSRAGSYLRMYSQIIGFIKKQKFESDLLNEYQQRFFKGDHSANKSIKRLAKILDRFDLRLNAMVGIPLNLLFYWDIWQFLRFEHWKTTHRGDIPQWLEGLGDFEAISSFASLSFNNKDWVFPRINGNKFTFIAKDIGHPLIPVGKRICNDIEFEGSGKMLLVTGSNMSGKSTFLRTIGVNMVLAGAGAPVCAKTCEISILTPFTSMRIADSLDENISTFYAELRRIADIIKAVDQKEPVILLLDEVLRGTNSNDRHRGALALLRQLVNSDAVGVMATHDLELADHDLINDGRIMPFFFDVQVSNDELFFDYKLHQGQCTTMNASILMRKMGIRMDWLGE